MDIDYALIADYADLAAGKLYLMGGGWDTITVADVPATMRIAVAIGVRFGWEETNRPTAVTITIEDDDGAALVTMQGQVNVGRPAGLPPGSTQLAQMAANAALTIAKPGGFRVRIQAGEGGPERALPFRVNRRAAAPG